MYAFMSGSMDIRVAHSVQSKNKNRKSEAGTRSIYANYRNKILCKKSLELDSIWWPSSSEVLYVIR